MRLPPVQRRRNGPSPLSAVQCPSLPTEWPTAGTLF
jgi:hypothetical protein